MKWLMLIFFITMVNAPINKGQVKLPIQIVDYKYRFSEPLIQLKPSLDSLAIDLENLSLSLETKL